MEEININNYDDDDETFVLFTTYYYLDYSFTIIRLCQVQHF